MRKLSVVLLALSIAVTGCGGGSGPEQSRGPEQTRTPEYLNEPERVPMTELNPSDYEAISRRDWWPERWANIVRSRDEWRALWAKSSSQGICLPDPCEGPTIPMPEFDFGQYSLVAIFGDRSPTESVFARSVTVTPEGLQVLTLRQKSMSDDALAQMQHRFAIVFLIPATTSPVTFLEEKDAVVTIDDPVVPNDPSVVLIGG